MLIKYYAASKSQTLNHQNLCQGCQSCVQKSYRNLEYRTTATDVFENVPPRTLHQLFEEQLKSAIQESQLFLKYSFLTVRSAESTRQQYEKFYFKDGHAYLKSQLKTLAAAQSSQESTFVGEIPSSNDDQPDNQPKNRQPQEENVVYVSKDAIRQITEYTFDPIPKWSQTQEPVHIQWQQDLLEDESEFIVVDGSRQIGKSHTIAEKLVEESFIPDNDSLVGAFRAKTTDVIKNYVMKHVRKFPNGIFEEFKKDGYVINLRTLTKIYFRTLADDAADGVRGLTLKRVIVDEAQLVSDYVYDEILNPTMSTTGGQMILIGTAGRKRSGYMFGLINDIRKGRVIGSYYRISADENPLLHPTKRKWIDENRHLPSVRREYFNEWGDVGDTLFHIPRAQSIPPLDVENDFFVLGIDPARLNDRSGYAIIHVSGDKLTIVQSGFVPDSHKKDWRLQGKWYVQTIIKNYMERHPKYRPTANEWPSDKWYDVMDVSGVGDGAEQVFRTEGLKIHAKIRYTSGISETDDGLNYKVGKTVLINTLLDLCQEGRIELYEPTNQYLVEEMSYIEEGDSKAGTVTMKTQFFDDVTNATMIAAYFAVKRRLMGRSKNQPQPDDQSPYRRFDHIEAIERKREERMQPTRGW